MIEEDGSIAGVLVRDTTTNLAILHREVERSPKPNPDIDESKMTGEELYRQNMRWCTGIANSYFSKRYGSSERNGRILAAALRGMWKSTLTWESGRSHFKSYAHRRVEWEIVDELGIRRKRDRFFEVDGQRVEYSEGDGDGFSHDIHNHDNGAYSTNNAEDFMMKDVVMGALGKMKDDRLRDIVKVYYEIDTEGNNTYREIAETHGITKQRVEQLLKKAVKELRRIVMRDMVKKGMNREEAIEVLFGENK